LTCPAAPGLQRALPAAARPDGTTRVVLFGKDLGDATRLWTSFAARTEFVSEGSDASRAVFQITLDADALPGLGAVRVHGPGGVSPLLMFLIDDLTSMTAAGDHHARDTAQEVAVPGAVDGLAKSLKLDFYSIQATQGQRMAVDVVARRLGSRMDPVVRLLDSEGRELIYVDDEPGLGPDCRFRHTFADSGVHLLEIRDVNYQGGGESFYRLRLGDFPLATLPFPFAVPAGETASVMLLGREGNGPCVAVTVAMPADAAGWCLPVGEDAGDARAYALLRAGRLKPQMEAEPNDTAAQAVPFDLPAALYGRFETPRDRDVYQFEGRKNLRVVAKARTRSAGSPCDLWMQLQRMDGSSVAESKVQDGEDGAMDHRLPEDGRYLLVVEEINFRGGPDFAYGIEVAEFAPGFELSVETDRVNTRPGGEFSIKVMVERMGYEGPVTLAIEGLDEGVALEDPLVPEKKNETTLKVKLPATWASQTLAHFSITGSAPIGDRTFQARASILPALQKAFPQTREFPPGLEHRIALGIEGDPPDPPLVP
jgi:hypothetical protein